MDVLGIVTPCPTRSGPSWVTTSEFERTVAVAIAVAVWLSLSSLSLSFSSWGREGRLGYSTQPYPCLGVLDGTAVRASPIKDRRRTPEFSVSRHLSATAQQLITAVLRGHRTDGEWTYLGRYPGT